jgi:hypothetical protein
MDKNAKEVHDRQVQEKDKEAIETKVMTGA